jgi:hypothetical protein
MAVLVTAILNDILGRSGAFLPVSGILKNNSSYNN